MQDVILQKQVVRDVIEKLRNAEDAALAALNEDPIHRRVGLVPPIQRQF